jgi:hypothetical protein
MLSLRSLDPRLLDFTNTIFIVLTGYYHFVYLYGKPVGLEKVPIWLYAAITSGVGPSVSFIGEKAILTFYKGFADRHGPHVSAAGEDF